MRQQISPTLDPVSTDPFPALRTAVQAQYASVPPGPIVAGEQTLTWRKFSTTVLPYLDDVYC